MNKPLNIEVSISLAILNLATYWLKVAKIKVANRIVANHSETTKMNIDNNFFFFVYKRNAT